MSIVGVVLIMLIALAIMSSYLSGYKSGYDDLRQRVDADMINGFYTKHTTNVSDAECKAKYGPNSFGCVEIGE
jgi:hypothetical protein